MKTVYQIVFALFSLPTFLFCMEDQKKHPFHIVCHTPQYSLPQQADSFYKQATNLLNSFDIQSTPSVASLLTFMNEINAQQQTYSNGDYDEMVLGYFAYTKPSSLQETIGFRPSNIHISLFFKQLKQYHDQVTVSNKRTPTIPEWKAYLHNYQLKKSLKDALETTALRCNIIIDQDAIDYTKEPFQLITSEATSLAAFAELHNLCDIIKNLINDKNSARLKILADIVYLNCAPVQ